MKSFGYLAAFLGGAVVGAAAGLLLAPEKGSDTREKVGKAIDDFMKKHNIKMPSNDVDDLVNDLQDAIDEL